MAYDRYDTPRIELDSRGVATVMLNRPDKHNSLNAALISDLTDAATALAEDRAVRIVVLTGAGRSFCAGGDFNWFASNVQKSRAERVEQSASLARLLRRLDTLPKPLIGRINGPAYGGGVGLISVCDYAIGAEGARFGLTRSGQSCAARSVQARARFVQLRRISGLHWPA